ncbi:PepSY-associated TM helix domain-containing protein [Gloeobacter morelensis]|uniref:PepSY domain-containing protein n=1 Tax=Gloeobacter morelensis MG652769 TaxID=2781736 RepID=A0ABY3PJU3_9CYAN|nr:PepSY-associated TM helix domain-containing protein [Gloeobacter morelensis]UFP93837.1 PepSY domain-containing protein [Gloeobacter morelensis MG652769]
MAIKLRPTALFVHQLAGVVTGLLMVVIGLTGSAIVFHHELEQMLYPQLTRVAPTTERVTVEQVARTARATLSDRQLHRLLVPQKPGDVWVAMMQSNSKNLIERFTNVYIDPHNGQVLGVQPYAQNLLVLTEQLHISLLAGATGRIVVGVAGIVLVVLGVSGLLLWPGWRRWQAGVSLRRSANSRIVNYDLHKITGILSALLLVLTAATGAALIFYTPIERALVAVTGERAEPPKVSSAPRTDRTFLPLDRLQAVADATLPGARTISIFPAKKPDDPVRFRMRFDAEIQPNGRSFVHIDAYSGKVLQARSALEEPFSSAFFSWAYALHVGSWGGLFTKVLYVLAGLAPGLLFWTGFALWLDRLKKGPRQRRRSAALSQVGSE